MIDPQLRSCGRPGCGAPATREVPGSDTPADPSRPHVTREITQYRPVEVAQP